MESVNIGAGVTQRPVKVEQKHPTEKKKSKLFLFTVLIDS